MQDADDAGEYRELRRAVVLISFRHRPVPRRMTVGVARRLLDSTADTAAVRLARVRAVGVE